MKFIKYLGMRIGIELLFGLDFLCKHGAARTRADEQIATRKYMTDRLSAVADLKMTYKNGCA